MKPIDQGTTLSGASPPTGGLLQRLFSSFVHAVVVASLAGLAYWGHHTGWSFAAASKPITATADDLVIAVDTATGAAASAGWCAEHGVHDCSLCHPEKAQLEKPPVLTEADRQRVQHALMLRTRATNEPQGLPLPCVLRFPSVAAVDKLGIDIAPAWQTTMTEAITASGEVGFDPSRVARVTARTAGAAWQVRKQVGERVQAGEILALLDAAEVGKAKAALQQALVQVQLRAQALTVLNGAAGVVSERQLREAEAALRAAETNELAAEQALINLGLPVRGAELKGLGIEAVSEALQRLGLPQDLSQSSSANTFPGTLLPIRAPLAGTVLEADLIAGEVVEPGRLLFIVADPSQLWLTLHVRANEARWLTRGQQVRFRADGSDTDTTSTLTWIGTSANEKTRTIPVRAELNNEAGTLRAFTFGVGRIVLRDEPAAVVVPRPAIQQVAGATVVFVRDKDFLKPDGPRVFHVRTVRTGAEAAANTEILVGLLPGEIVATQNSGLLANEVRKTLKAHQ